MSKTKVFRCFTEKRSGFDIAADNLCRQLIREQGVTGLKHVRILCRYDVEGIDNATYSLAKSGVFSEPACDIVYDEQVTISPDAHTLIVAALPGQFDMRADSCSQCIALMTQGPRPTVRCATLYVLEGDISPSDMDNIRSCLINPVESTETVSEKPQTLLVDFPVPSDVPVLNGFIKESNLEQYMLKYSLAMDIDDLLCLQKYFVSEGRDPSVTELKMIDTYWSDHCRHTTFSTHLTEKTIEDEAVTASFEEYMEARRELYGDKASSRPVTLMDVATCGAKILKKRGILVNLDESEEINACSVKITANIDGKLQPWLLMFKNETHNHPTEIEPFGGAATCLGGAIRDPLSGRAYVYQAMRVTGAASPIAPLNSTLPGKLPQVTICRKAAAGYSSYGNQIGLSTGLVSEVYHDGYVAKRLETGAVVGAAPCENVVREVPADGDVVVLLGGKTGRDGCGGATGSSKSHSTDSLAQCGAEVQKGNAPEERKIQRLFRNGDATRLIKRCNDFGAGGVSVAVGELADGLMINLDAVPKKYDGLDGTELAISESQERLAVVLDRKNLDAFCAFAAAENLDATVIAQVTADPRLKMTWRGKVICDISREFLNSNGATKSTPVFVPKMDMPKTQITLSGNLEEKALSLFASLNVSIAKGLGTRFDGSIGIGSVLMPYGGKNQLTPAQVMAAKLPVLEGETTTASVMSYGFDPAYMAQNPYIGAQGSVLSSIAKLVAAGCDPSNVYLSFQEFFERPNRDPKRFGKPFAALLGAFSAQTALGAGAIGGKDSMSGTFNDIDVPPTLISFAISTENAANIISPEFKKSGSSVYFFEAPKSMNDTRLMWDHFRALANGGKVLSAWAVSCGGIAEGIAKMAIGNDIGFVLDKNFPEDKLFELNYGGIIAEMSENCGGILIGTAGSNSVLGIPLSKVKSALTSTLENVYPTNIAGNMGAVQKIVSSASPTIHRSSKIAMPTAVIPVFPGTNCEYDTAKALRLAGGKANIVLIRNSTPDALKQSALDMAKALSHAQMLIIPGGFSGGDEPDGSGKFIQAFFRNPALTDAVHNLLYSQDGLALGICNGFQALVKLGLLPFGKVCDLDENCPTVTFNTIGRHQSIYTNTRVASIQSPWLSSCKVDDVYNIPFSHGEGRFMASDSMLKALIENGQVAFQYCDASGNPSMDIDVNINGSCMAIEGISSPDGRILGKMGHSERVGDCIAKNISGNKYQPLFAGGVQYFK